MKACSLVIVAAGVWFALATGGAAGERPRGARVDVGGVHAKVVEEGAQVVDPGGGWDRRDMLALTHAAHIGNDDAKRFGDSCVVQQMAPQPAVGSGGVLAD